MFRSKLSLNLSDCPQTWLTEYQSIWLGLWLSLKLWQSEGLTCLRWHKLHWFKVDSLTNLRRELRQLMIWVSKQKSLIEVFRFDRSLAPIAPPYSNYWNQWKHQAKAKSKGEINRQIVDKQERTTKHKYKPGHQTTSLRAAKNLFTSFWIALRDRQRWLDCSPIVLQRRIWRRKKV